MIAMKSVDLQGVRVISCDVFDTLLQRNAIAEPGRVKRIAQRAAEMLREERGVVIEVEALARARARAQRLAYRALDMADPNGEVGFDALMQGMALGLGLGVDEARVLARAEIAVEQTQLSPNAALLGWLAWRSADGLRIIAVSDTWHSAATIRGLLDRVAPGNPVAKVYTSADLGATKRSSAIFPKVLEAEGEPAQAFFHIGDDALADEAMAQRAGLRSHRIVPPRRTIFARRLDAARARVMRAMPEQ
ncbi:HAD family hydrolase [Novosphingobium profundi]|uniref:hypothetical protein n=1 Tax=Novosphingobium profundi TaxID=1774954 RepID=UPI001BDA0303|nr:hypothetical protein [Novosphingobium profundi]MBT0668685.1 HAD family hydrolase [Novosphingobium profundi]